MRRGGIFVIVPVIYCPHVTKRDVGVKTGIRANGSDAIQTFVNTEFGNIRMLNDTLTGKILFCGKDVAEALGYSDTKKAIERHTHGGTKRPLIDTLGREQEAIFIPEGDVYRLIVRSNLPTAEKFERWVFDEDKRGSIIISYGTSTLGGNPCMLIINEPGLYSLILRSRMPQVKNVGITELFKSAHLRKSRASHKRRMARLDVVWKKTKRVQN